LKKISNFSSNQSNSKDSVLEKSHNDSLIQNQDKKMKFNLDLSSLNINSL